jgi:hypothetical protein
MFMTKAEELAALPDGNTPLAHSADDEPIFVLVARDKLAASIVRVAAERMRWLNVSQDRIDSATRIAAEMDSWRARNGGGKVPD